MSKSFATFAVDETTLVFAFRYALGRRSTAPGHVADLLKTYWPRLELWTREQIHRDIQHAIENDAAGDKCDEQRWGELLALQATSPAVEVCPRCEFAPHICVCSHDDNSHS